MIVADRELQGWPGTTVELHVELDGTCRVEVLDRTGIPVLLFEGYDRQRAADCFKHPFAFGYIAPEFELTEVS